MKIWEWEGSAKPQIELFEKAKGPRRKEGRQELCKADDDDARERAENELPTLAAAAASYSGEKWPNAGT